jgi:molecular chaperone DnaK
MKQYVGIDLGTTNSAICTYNGLTTRIWKSPEQNDVTPSVIYVDRRARYFGRRAYDAAPQNPDNAASLFKRLMGTSTPIKLQAVNLTMTPEECSAEILKVLFGYLPEEIRNDPDTGTVITVPAAFNQMQKDATMQASEMAGIGKVALMQEPVAAVMSVMRTRNADGIFLIYDFGGGTLDVAIAECISGRVSMLAHGGIARCGGRDFDRVLVDSIVCPWLAKSFDLPDGFAADPSYKKLMRLAALATERAKIELSSREESKIELPESQVATKDRKGNEIYLDITLTRKDFDALISERITESIAAARDTLAKAGLTSNNLERIVFVGGPTSYKPLRDKVASELGIPGSTEVNPMTAVAEGASLFAESIDWSTQNRARKESRGRLSAGKHLSVTFKFSARTPDVKTKIVLDCTGQVASGTAFQVDSIDTGWTSGRIVLKNGASVEVTLPKPGENNFKVFVFDVTGGPISLEQDKIVITRTAASPDAIPASHSICVEAREKLGGRPSPFYLIQAGDRLPKEGKRIFKAAESLKAGAAGSLNFKIWEGEIDNPVSDNRPVGVLKIRGSDFDDGVIPAGAELICEYKILDSGTIDLEVSVPCIGGSFKPGKNFYSRQEGQYDFSADAMIVIEEGGRAQNRIDEMGQVVDAPKLEQARKKIESATSLDPEETDVEKTQDAMENVLEARRLMASVKKEHIKEIRQLELDGVVKFFDEHLRSLARPSEVTTFDSLAKTAQRSITNNDAEFEHHLDNLRGKNFSILWRQDWFVVDRFNTMVKSPHLFQDQTRFEELAQVGVQCLRVDDIEKLRTVVAQLYTIKGGGEVDGEMYDDPNIIAG